jgi:fucose permease
MSQPTKQEMSLFLLVIAFIAFISLGLPDGLLGVAWPSMHEAFSVPVNSMGFLILGGTMGYVVSTFLSGKLVRLMGVGRLLSLSCFLTASALFGYTISPAFPLTIALGFVAGLGGGAIDAGINNYISHHYRKMLFLLHAMFGIGTTIGPLIMNIALNTATWRAGYWVVAGFQLLLSITFFFTAKRWDAEKTSDEDAPKQSQKHARLRETIKLPIVLLGMAFFLLYTGIEVSVGQWSYTILTEARAIDTNTAALFVGLYWGAFTLGRFVSPVIVNLISERRFMQLGMIAMVLGTLLMWLNIPTISLLALPLIGFSLAPMFPAMIGSTQDRLPEEHVDNAIGFQIGMAGFGAGVLATSGGAIAGILDLNAISLMNFIVALAIFALYEIIMRAGEKTKRELKEAQDG